MRIRRALNFGLAEIIPRTRSACGSCLKDDKPENDYHADYRIVLPDGTIKHLHAVGHPVLNESGDLVEFVGTTMDVTEQVQTRAALENALQEIKQRNEALRASEQNLDLIINTIPALVWSARPDGSAEFFNQHYLDYVGLSAEQVKDWGWTACGSSGRP